MYGFTVIFFYCLIMFLRFMLNVDFPSFMMILSDTKFFPSLIFVKTPV